MIIFTVVKSEMKHRTTWWGHLAKIDPFSHCIIIILWGWITWPLSLAPVRGQKSWVSMYFLMDTQRIISPLPAM
jgi:hypothetical protein